MLVGTEINDHVFARARCIHTIDRVNVAQNRRRKQVCVAYHDALAQVPWLVDLTGIHERCQCTSEGVTGCPDVDLCPERLIRKKNLGRSLDSLTDRVIRKSCTRLDLARENLVHEPAVSCNR